MRLRHEQNTAESSIFSVPLPPREPCLETLAFRDFGLYAEFTTLDRNSD
jgi:hypothetical protein